MQSDHADLIVSVLKKQGLPLIKVLHALLSAHELDHLAERLTGILAAEKEPTTPFQQHCEILHVGAGEIVQTDLEHVQNDVGGNDVKLGEIGEERYVAHADFGKLLHNVLLALEIPELFIQLK